MAPDSSKMIAIVWVYIKGFYSLKSFSRSLKSHMNVSDLNYLLMRASLLVLA